MIIGVAIPAWQRHELVTIVIDQLRRCDQQLAHHQIVVSVAVSEDEDPGITDACGDADIVTQCRNAPLGRKANAAYRALQGTCDAVVGLGSDDLVTPELFLAWARLLETYDYCGLLDYYALDPHVPELRHWLGYGWHEPSTRIGEPVGAGRVLSASVLEALGWEPFADGVDCGLDGTLERRLSRVPHRRCAIPSAAIDALVIDVKLGPNISPMPAHDWIHADVVTFLERFDDIGARVLELRG